MRFLVALLALTLPAFAQIRYSPTGFTAPFISTVTNQASAQAYLGISGGGGGSVTNFGGSATNLQVYSSGTTNRPLRVFGGSQTNSNPTQILNTWNNSGATFTGFEVVATNTAAAVGSIVARFGASDMAGGSFPLTVYDRYTRFGSYGAGAAYDARMESVTGGTDIVAYDNNTRGVGLSYTGVNIKSSLGLLWWSGAAYSGAVDSAIYRNSAGVLEINSGTVGTYRDLVTRSTFATNASITNITADSYVTTQQTLSYASATNLTVDANKSLHFVSLTNTAYFAQPSNLGVGRTFTVILRQDGTGTRAVTFNTNYWKFPNGTQPSITTNANAYDVLSCIACPYGTNVFTVHNAKFQ